MTDFDGFQATDFKENVTGTTWRAKLGKILAQRLTQETGIEYKSSSIYPRPEIYLAPHDHFPDDFKFSRGKFFVHVRSYSLTFGFYIEKGYGLEYAHKGHVMDNTWDWPFFLQVIRQPEIASLIQKLLHQGYLIWHYKEGAADFETITIDDKNQLTLNKVDSSSHPVNWSDICINLSSVDPETWLDWSIGRKFTPPEVVQRGTAITNEIIEVFQELMPLFKQIANRDFNGGMMPTIKELAQYFKVTKGLFFTPDQIATYITALQTKGLVILSGISGTGKTKLAQAFAELLQAEDAEKNYLFLSVRPDWRDNKSLLGYYNPLTEKYESTELLRFILDAQEVSEPTPPVDQVAVWLKAKYQEASNQQWLNEFRQFRARFAGKTLDQLNTDDLDWLWQRKSNPVSGIGQAFTARLPSADQLLVATEIVMDLQRTPGQRFIEATEALKSESARNIHHWARVWRAIATFDPDHVHTIVHGSKIRDLLNQLGYDKPADPRNLARQGQAAEIDRGLKFIMDEVDRLLPDLNDPIKRAMAPWLLWESYFKQGSTLPTQPVLAANELLENPFFVILDEMNLARVEYYFADFLSVLEGGRLPTGRTKEAVRLHAFESEVKDREGRTIPATLYLPANVYFIGTVNVDETTHAFSPKVLDRAFTIEFESANLSSYTDQQGAAQLSFDSAGVEDLLKRFSRQGRFAQIEKEVVQTFNQNQPQYIAALQQLEAELRPYELHFGYRVADEILMFLANASQYGWFDELGGLPAAFDSAVLMKVLPKFHGPRTRLEEPLRQLINWAGTPTDIQESIKPSEPHFPSAIASIRAKLSTLPVDYTTFHCPRVALKCTRMLYNLYTTGFAAFS